MTTIVLLVTCGMLENLKAVLAQEVAGILMPSTKVVKHIRVGGGAVFTHLKVSRYYRQGKVSVIFSLELGSAQQNHSRPGILCWRNACSNVAMQDLSLV